MPPTFVYALALTVYVAVACLVLGVAALFTIPRATRSVALRVAAGMVGSFPGVLLFQALSAPIVALMLLTSGLIMSITSRGGWIDAALIGVGLIALAVFTLASLAGFCVGWRTGWEVAAGRSVRTFLREHSILGPIFRALSRFVPGLGA
jgi:hypothetical protein